MGPCGSASQNHLTLGLAAYPAPSEVNYPKLLEMPFDKQRYPPWVRPDSTVPHRDKEWIPTPTAIVPEPVVELLSDSRQPALLSLTRSRQSLARVTSPRG